MDRVPEATGDYSVLTDWQDHDFMFLPVTCWCGIAMFLPLGESPVMLSPAE
jgi:hypothetical protein